LPNGHCPFKKTLSSFLDVEVKEEDKEHGAMEDDDITGGCKLQFQICSFVIIFQIKIKYIGGST
jgi:hypothetical protein